jgi:LuxR family maltose regulon positive regulatory protein
MAITGVPRIPSATLARPRLVRRFDGDEAIVLAQAPAGYGKSIAMAQWAAATRAEGIWLRVREGNAGSEAFVQHLAAELVAARLVDDTHPLRFAAEALAGGAEPWPLLRRGLAGSPDLTLAIDGMDRLDPECVDGLVELVHDLPRVSIRGTARRRSAMNEPALALRIDVAIIGVEELALTAAEVAEALSLDVASPTVERIISSGGLPLVMRLAAQQGDNPPGSAPDSSMRAVVDSLIDTEIAAGAWEPRFLRFIQATSVAESMDMRLATDLALVANAIGPDGDEADTDDTHAAVAALLDRAESEGLGLWTGASRASGTFSYTPLVREALERRLRLEQPQRIEELVVAAARWELAAGRPYLALRRAVQLRDWQLASLVVRSYWNELMRNHGEQVRALFRGVPLSVLHRHPLVAMLLALEYNRTGHHRLRALEYFALAVHGARAQREHSAPADRAVLRAIEAASLRVSGRLDGALAAALDGRATLQAMSPDDRDELGRVEPTLHNQIGTTLFYAGRTEEALDEFARSTAVGAAKGLKAGLQGMALSAGALAVAGDLPEARAMMSAADALDWPEGWLTGYMGSLYQVAAAFSALESGDPDEADRRIRSLDPHRETIEHWPLLAHLDALVALFRGSPERARLRLEAEMLVQRRRRALAPQTAARLSHTRSLIEIAAGRLDTAEKLLGKTPSSRRSTGMARIALARARPDEALRLLLGADTGAGDHPSSRSRAEALALRAGALALTDDSERAHAALGELLDLLDDRGQMLALASVPAGALDAMIVLSAAHADGPGHPALELARRHSLVASTSPAPALTGREIALARALPHARRAVDLAALLSVSPNTVKTQMRGLYRKLGVGSRAEAIAALSVMGLVEAPAEADPRAEAHPFDSERP